MGQASRMTLKVRLRLVLPLPPNRANARGHWRKAHREKKAYWSEVDQLAMTRKIPRPPVEPWSRAELSAHLYVWNEFDEDNAVSLLKWIQDWLVSRGYVAGDRRKNLRLAGVPEQTIDRENPRVEIVVRPIADATP